MSLAVTLGEGATKPDEVVKIDRGTPPKFDVTREELGEVQHQVAMKLGEQVNLPILRTHGVRLINQRSGTVVPRGFQIAEKCRIHLLALMHTKT